jgi:hypothetical protein
MEEIIYIPEPENNIKKVHIKDIQKINKRRITDEGVFFELMYSLSKCNVLTCKTFRYIMSNCAKITPEAWDEYMVWLKNNS